MSVRSVRVWSSVQLGAQADLRSSYSARAWRKDAVNTPAPTRAPPPSPTGAIVRLLQGASCELEDAGAAGGGSSGAALGANVAMTGRMPSPTRSTTDTVAREPSAA